MMKIISQFFTVIYLFMLASTANAVPVASYSEMYMYDSQDYQTDTTASPDSLISDPFAVINKHIFNINYLLDAAFFRPAAETYLYLMPARGRMHVGNFMSNIGEPINCINLIFQGKFKQARISLGRFMTNSLLGFFGIMDVATEFKLQYKGEDFGQTLAYHKIPTGPYLVAPILGPTSTRDLSGKVADFFMDPFKYSLTKEERNIINATWLLHKRANANEIIKTVNNSLDPYEAAKALYIQNRISQINN